MIAVSVVRIRCSLKDGANLNMKVPLYTLHKIFFIGPSFRCDKSFSKNRKKMPKKNHEYYCSDTAIECRNDE